MGDVLVVCDTAILVHLHEKVVVNGLHLVLLAYIAGKQSRIEMGSCLVGVISPSIQVVYIEAEGQPLVGIDGEIGFETFLAIHFASCLVISQVGVGNVTVGELDFVRTDEETGKGFHEMVGSSLRRSKKMRESRGEPRFPR